MNTKNDIRRAMIEKRMEIAPENHKTACGYLCEKLLSIPLPAQSIIAGYKAIKGEMDISQALMACHDKKYRLCLPSVTVPERIMHFLTWRPKMAMKKGAHGTLEPDGGEVVVPTTIWIPLVAFDLSGHRLGYGGGYYDATLANLKKTHHKLQTIGIAFAFQEVDKLPHESHDMKLDMIVTDKEVIGIT